MPCYHPVDAYRTPTGITFNPNDKTVLHPMQIPCGQCTGCRLRRAQDWMLRCKHEAAQWDHNCFVTLTYGRDKLPPNGSLHYPDYQAFMKRLRSAYEGQTIRFYMCGEYGPTTLRPHYHACLFNLDFADKQPCGKSASGNLIYKSQQLEKLWGHGLTTVQPFTPQTAAYTARYVVDKLTGALGERSREHIDADGEIQHRTPEFSKSSLKPGIGATWYAKFQKDVHPNDYVIHEGRKHQVPKYYDKLLAQTQLGEQYEDEIKYQRQQRANTNAHDNTQERLQTKETVKRAQLRNHKRTEI